MMEDIGKWLIIGLVIAGLITVYVPDTFFQQYASSPLLSILLVLVCAIPMYLCATGSIPIASSGSGWTISGQPDTSYFTSLPYKN